MSGCFVWKFTVILLPALSCCVTNEVTAHSHTRITKQNSAHLIGRVTEDKKTLEEKRLGQLGKQSSIGYMDNTDSQDTADGISSTTSSNVTPPRKKE